MHTWIVKPVSILCTYNIYDEIAFMHIVDIYCNESDALLNVDIEIVLWHTQMLHLLFYKLDTLISADKYFLLIYKLVSYLF